MSSGISHPEDKVNWAEHDHYYPTMTATGLRAGIIASVLLALIIVSLRLYTRVSILKRLGPDDYLVSSAMIMSIGMMIIALKGTNNGWGLQVEDIPEEWYNKARYYSYLAQIVFVPVTTLTKFSILYSYLRISPNRAFQHRIYFLFVWTALWCVATFVALVFRCTPIRAYWISGIDGSTCVNSQALVLASGALNSLTDLAVALLPAPIVWKAKLPKKERGGLVLLFSFAGTVCVVGVARWGVYYNTTETQGMIDCTWGGGVAVVLGIVETCTGIAGASISALRPLWSHCMGDKRQSEIVNDTGTPDNLGKDGSGDRGQDPESAAEPSTGAFSYAATRPPTPAAGNKTPDPKGPSSPIQTGSPFNIFKNADLDMTLGQRLSRRLSIATGRVSPVGDDYEARRISTGRTWLSLGDGEEEMQDIGGPARFSEASTTVHSLERDATRRKDSQGSDEDDEEQGTVMRRSICRSPTPPLPPGIEIPESGPFSFAATATTTPVLTAKSSKVSLRPNDLDDPNAQSTLHIASASSSTHQTERRDMKRWIPEFTLPFRARSRGRTLDSTDTFELATSRSHK